MMKQCNKISKRKGLKQRQSYQSEVKKLLIKVRFSRHPCKAKVARAAQRKMKTIAGRLTRE